MPMTEPGVPRTIRAWTIPAWVRILNACIADKVHESFFFCAVNEENLTEVELKPATSGLLWQCCSY